ncbi:MAG: helix-turn-helix domain-containing protein [Deltaproteobacteria bacterium]|nr:helix-turn-helix domain-containing protein [Deltaproteobacteria bacterium]
MSAACYYSGAIEKIAEKCYKRHMTQSQALSILKTGANVFLTGEPGSGKTHTVNEYVAYLRARGIEPAITASTGIAATHIGGMTIHSWSGIGIKTKLDKYDFNKIASSRHIAKRVLRAKVLIIDEVSMLHPEALSMIDAICREIRRSSEPFGGIQVVLVGDFFQLPPIVKTKDGIGAQRSLIEEPSARFSYDSPAWGLANPTVCYITEQHRQDDGDFLLLLSAIRRNAFDSSHLRHIETRKVERHTAPDGAPKLLSHNADVDRVNNEILAGLPGEPHVFAMSSQGHDALAAALKKGCLSPETLYLKVGAAVMFTKNNPKEGFVNGTLGAVEEFDAHSGCPIVKIRSGRRIKVETMDWAVEETGKTLARITQLPLRLAWAITVHKSQGMSLDEAVMDLRGVLEFGQGYVALSRLRRLSGLHLLGWNGRAFQVHPEVLAKDAQFRAQSEQAAHMAGDKSAAIHERFIRSCGGKIIPKDHDGLPKTPRVPRTTPMDGNSRGERRWEDTLELVRSGKTIAAVAEMRGRTEGTILRHLESLLALGRLPARDIAHLARGSEQAIAGIHDAFRALDTDKLFPVFEKLGGAYSYDKLRIARLLLNERFPRESPAQSGFGKVSERHSNAYRPWDKAQDEKLRELFMQGSSVVDIAKAFDRTSGAIKSRLARLGLLYRGISPASPP